ncbi:MAG: ABC transporter [Anaerolineaceae bacterium]|nr:ABC transporter [Anaerolineaceae bacterium]
MITAADRRIWLIIGAIVAVFALLVPLSTLIWGVNYDYTLVTVATGGAVLGVVSGVLGSFAVLRQQSLMGDALSHAALPGVAIAFLLFGRELGWLLIGAGVAGWLGVMFINGVTRTTRIKQDAAMGIALTAFFAFGITLLTYIQSRNDASQAGLDQFIFGQAAAIKRQDVLLISTVGLIAFLIVGLFWKEFKLITFDPQFARANGFAVRILDVLLSTLIVVAIVLGLQLAGVILMVGLLIAPAVAARQWTQKLGQMIVLSGVFGGFAGAAGAILSGIQAGLPTGPLIIVVAFTIVFLSIAFAPDRGLVWTLWRRRQDRQRFAAQNVLRDVYRHAMQHNDPAYPAPGGMLTALRGSVVRVGLRQLEQTGLVRRVDGDSWALTDTGLAAAREDARNLQLWDLYRLYAEELRLPSVAEEHQKPIKSVLPREQVSRLEALLERDNSF